MAKKPIEYVEIEVDGKVETFRKGEILLWALREKGYDIPHFCAHKWLEPFAGCRMCLVQIEMGGRMMPKLQPSCAMTASEGLKVFTDVPEVIEVRKEQLEFHLINHPLECPICDKGGECMLQDQCNDHGLNSGRYLEQKRVREDKIITDYIRMNYKRCIQCKRCVHFCQDIDGSHLIKFLERGAETRIEGFPKEGVADRFSGNTIDMCPVGALTARNYRFMGRPWEQEEFGSVGSLDSVGANITLCSRLGSIARIIPRDNEDVENGLIDDATRFSWEAIDDPRRLRKAILRAEDGSTEEVSQYHGEHAVAERLGEIIGEHGPGSVGVIAGAGLNTEEYLALKKFSGEVLESGWYHFGDELFGPGGMESSALHSFTHSYAPIKDILECSTVLSIGCDMFDEAPSLGLRLDVKARRGHLKLLSARSHLSDNDWWCAQAATYTYGDQLRFIRGLANSITGQGEVPEDVKPLTEHLKSIGEDMAIIYGQEIWRSESPPELIQALEDLRAAIAKANPGAQGVYLCPVYPSVNSVGALLVNYLEQFTTYTLNKVQPPAGSLAKVLRAAADGTVKALLVFDSDPLTTYPNRELVQSALNNTLVLYVGPYRGATADHARVHVPLGTYAHKQGTVVSMEWRVQQRCRPLIMSQLPSVSDIVNRVATLMGHHEMADDEDELRKLLHTLVEDWPGPRDKCGGKGFLVNIHSGKEGQLALTNLPAAVQSADGQLTLVPKRFLYNDRPEIHYSPVFDRVAKPFAAYFNQVDFKKLGLSPGAPVQLAGGGGTIELPAQSAKWVRPGSVVVNDYCLAAPVNRLAGHGAVNVSVAKSVGASGG